MRGLGSWHSGCFPCVCGVTRNRRISTPHLPCFITELTGCTGCKLSAGRGDWIVSQHHQESACVFVYNGSCRKLASLVGALDPTPRCAVSPHWSDPATRPDTILQRSHSDARAGILIPGGAIRCVDLAGGHQQPSVDICRANRVPVSHDDVSWGRPCQCRHFLWCADTPSSIFGVCGCAGIGPVVGSFPSWVVKCYGPPVRPPSGVATTEGLWAHVAERFYTNMRLRYTACRWRFCTSCLARSFSLRGQLMMPHRCPRPSGVHTDGSDGTLAPSGWTGRARTGYCAPWRRLPRLYQAVCTGLTGLTGSRSMVHLDITKTFALVYISHDYLVWLLVFHPVWSGACWNCFDIF